MRLTRDNSLTRGEKMRPADALHNTTQRSTPEMKILVRRSEGQRLLREIASTLDVMCVEIGESTTKQMILDWRTGKRDPKGAARRRIYNAYAIPPAAWDQAWKDPHPTPPPAAAPAASTEPELDPVADAAPSVSKGDSTIDHCMALLAAIRAERVVKGLSAAERVKLVNSEASMLKMLADLQERRELSEDRYVREHPAWLRVRNVIAEALRPHPAAALAVADALDKLGA